MHVKCRQIKKNDQTSRPGYRRNQAGGGRRGGARTAVRKRESRKKTRKREKIRDTRHFKGYRMRQVDRGRARSLLPKNSINFGTSAIKRRKRCKLRHHPRETRQLQWLAMTGRRKRILLSPSSRKPSGQRCSPALPLSLSLSPLPRLPRVARECSNFKRQLLCLSTRGTTSFLTASPELVPNQA